MVGIYTQEERVNWRGQTHQKAVIGLSLSSSGIRRRGGICKDLEILEPMLQA